MKRFWSIIFFVVFVSLTAAFFSWSHALASPLKKPLSFQHFTPKEGLSSEMVNCHCRPGRRGLVRDRRRRGHPVRQGEKDLEGLYHQRRAPRQRTTGTASTGRIFFPITMSPSFFPTRIGSGSEPISTGSEGEGSRIINPRRTPPWKTFNTNNGQAKKIVSMAADRETLWVGSEKGLSMLDKKKEPWKGFISPQNGLSGNFVNALLAPIRLPLGRDERRDQPTS